MPFELTKLAEDFVFGEGPRWREDKLWFSDMHGEAIYRVGMDGVRETVISLPGRSPSGLGFLPDGSLLFVSMKERAIFRVAFGAESLYADLRDHTSDDLNDMVVSATGHAYVGSFPHERKTGVIIHIEPGGDSRVAAERMDFPNGSVITPDSKTLIVTESIGRIHTAFTIGADGTLSDRRIYAAVPDAAGDGLALDAEGALWSAQPLGHQFVRVLPGGEVTDRIETGDRMPVACALGGDDRQTLFLLTALDLYAEKLAGTRDSRVEYTRVAVPGAGLP